MDCWLAKIAEISQVEVQYRLVNLAVIRTFLSRRIELLASEIEDPKGESRTPRISDPDTRRRSFSRFWHEEPNQSSPMALEGRSRLSLEKTQSSEAPELRPSDWAEPTKSGIGRTSRRGGTPLVNTHRFSRDNLAPN